MKKGLSLPIEMIVIIAIVMLVLVVIVALFLQGIGGTSTGLDHNAAFAEGCTKLVTSPHGCNCYYISPGVARPSGEMGQLGQIKIVNYEGQFSGSKGTLFAACGNTHPECITGSGSQVTIGVNDAYFHDCCIKYCGCPPCPSF